MDPDARLLDDAVAEIRWDPRVRHEGVGLAVRGGAVTLTGTVATYAQKRAAERAVERVRGVSAVANDLAVVLQGAHAAGDPELARAAADALRWRAEVPPASVQVAVQDGWVGLSGSVDWEYQKRVAEEAVAGLVGVRGLDNGITVRPRASAPDVASAIRAALRRSTAGDAARVDVEIEGGTVTLRGHVRSWAERRDVEHAAWAAPGVTRVDDRIAVGP
jgi:osmotically-inducible protein OsmY